MAILYIIYSSKIDRYYIGITSEDITTRLQKHNQASYGSRYTSQSDDWETKLTINANDMSHARRMELYVKRRKSRIYLNDLITKDYLQQKLIAITLSP